MRFCFTKTALLMSELEDDRHHHVGVHRHAFGVKTGRPGRSAGDGAESLGIKGGIAAALDDMGATDSTAAADGELHDHRTLDVGRAGRLRILHVLGHPLGEGVGVTTLEARLLGDGEILERSGLFFDGLFSRFLRSFFRFSLVS